jgi:hypothetical protein
VDAVQYTQKVNASFITVLHRCPLFKCHQFSWILLSEVMTSLIEIKAVEAMQFFEINNAVL